MDGIEALKDVTVLAATNQPEALDLALLRPGRFDKLLYVAPPDLAGRTSILRIQSQKRTFAPSLDISELARLTDGYSGAELVSICNEASRKVYEECKAAGTFRAIGMEDFKEAIGRIPKQITEDVVRRFTEWGSGRGVGKINANQKIGGVGEREAINGAKEGGTGVMDEVEEVFMALRQKMKGRSEGEQRIFLQDVREFLAI